jgi:Fe2+ or Zn2+ uptake regulation protein
MTSQEILTILKNKGFRVTKTRQLILTVLEQLSAPVSEHELRLKMGTTVNKTTVYRELEFLKQQRFITELDFGEGKKRYELGSRHHHHVICTNCNTVEHVDIPNDLKSIEQNLSRKNKFKISGHALEFFGLCQNCQK